MPAEDLVRFFLCDVQPVLDGGSGNRDRDVSNRNNEQVGGDEPNVNQQEPHHIQQEGDQQPQEQQQPQRGGEPVQLPTLFGEGGRLAWVTKASPDTDNIIPELLTAEQYQLVATPFHSRNGGNQVGVDELDEDSIIAGGEGQSNAMEQGNGGREYLDGDGTDDEGGDGGDDMPYLTASEPGSMYASDDSDA